MADKNIRQEEEECLKFLDISGDDLNVKEEIKKCYNYIVSNYLEEKLKKILPKEINEEEKNAVMNQLPNNIKEIIENLNSSYQILTDSMNINDFIKVKRVKDIQFKSEIIKGFAMTKGAYSKIKRINKNDTKILILDFDLNEHEIKDPFEKENSKEKKNAIEMADYNNYINFPEIKENHKIKYKNVPLKRRTILNTINLGDFNFPPKKRYFISKITKMNHLIRNRSNLDNLNQLKVEENKDSMSLRELYRNLVLLHPNKKNNKKYKPELRKKQILEYINKNSIQSEKQINKKINSNLLSLENYVKYQNRNRNVKFKRNKNRLLMEELKLENNKKYFGSVGKQIEDNENFFNNILKSFSRTNDRINKTKIRMENCKNYLINIQTMMELNNKSNKK